MEQQIATTIRNILKETKEKQQNGGGPNQNLLKKVESKDRPAYLVFYIWFMKIKLAS